MLQDFEFMCINYYNKKINRIPFQNTFCCLSYLSYIGICFLHINVMYERWQGLTTRILVDRCHQKYMKQKQSSICLMYDFYQNVTECDIKKDDDLNHKWQLWMTNQYGKTISLFLLPKYSITFLQQCYIVLFRFPNSALIYVNYNFEDMFLS